MLKPTIYITGNYASESARISLIQKLTELHYDVKDFHPTNDYVQDAIKLANEVKGDKLHKVGILICNTGRSMINATQYVENVKNSLINKETIKTTSQDELGRSNIISMGVKEFTEEEIIEIALKFLKSFNKNQDENEECSCYRFKII
ncbi:RpiB/LacA/LacB family sugar-phosphate isomerase [Ureaplasma ceti]|uniref:Ribose-5-phosphate isomerase n=1 Tax=Ureaplasma ceti TaxID=3119530 RepID=A0ABP9UCD8_9BACT